MNRLVKERIRCGYLTYGRGDFPNERLRLVAGKAPDRAATGVGTHGRRSTETRSRGPPFAWSESCVVPACVPTGTPNQETGVLEMSIPTPNGPWGSGDRWGVRPGLSRPSGGFVQPHSANPICTLRHAADPGVCCIYRIRFRMRLRSPLTRIGGTIDEEPAPRLARTDYWLGEDVGPYEDTVRAALALGIPPVPDRRLTPLPVLIDDSGPPAADVLARRCRTLPQFGGLGFRLGTVLSRGQLRRLCRMSRWPMGVVRSCGRSPKNQGADTLVRFHVVETCPWRKCPQRADEPG